MMPRSSGKIALGGKIKVLKMRYSNPVLSDTKISFSSVSKGI